MKKVFFVMIIMVFIMSTNSIAIPTLVSSPKLDSISYVSGCIECGGGGVESINMDEHYANLGGELAGNFFENENGICGECNKKHTSSTIKISNMKYTYKIEDFSVTNEIVDGCGNKIVIMALIVRDYRAVIINDEDWYVHNSLISGNKRLLYNPTNNSLISFNKSEIDIYIEDDTGEGIDENRAQKVRVAPIYSDGYCVDDNVSVAAKEVNTGENVTSIFGDVFFICDSCVKCNTCNKTVASSGVTLGNSGEFYISNYCEEHACAFV